MTGDVCIRSEDGDYTIVDRTKELIKYSGFQVRLSPSPFISLSFRPSSSRETSGRCRESSRKEQRLMDS